MTDQLDENKKLINRTTRFSYAMATMYLIAALAGICYSSYSLVALKRTAFSYLTIVVSIIVAGGSILQFFAIRYNKKLMKTLFNLTVLTLTN